jgi:hypothetical protein
VRVALRVLVVLVVFGAFVYVSEDAGVPARLPGAALGWNLLFHLERAAAVLATAGVVFLVGWRALHGEFPIKFGQVEYAQKQAEAAAGVTEAQERRLRVVEVLTGIRDPADI